MGAMNEDMGDVDFDNLVIRGGDVGHIQLAAGQGTLSRGSVIDDTGTLLAADANARYILADETETDDTDTVTGVVYKSGIFVTDSLIVASGYTFDDDDAENLRDYGIVVEAAQ